MAPSSTYGTILFRRGRLFHGGMAIPSEKKKTSEVDTESPSSSPPPSPCHSSSLAFVTGARGASTAKVLPRKDSTVGDPTLRQDAWDCSGSQAKFEGDTVEGARRRFFFFTQDKD